MRRDIFLGAVAIARLTAAQNDEDDDDQVSGDERIEECFPDDPTAPCVSIENIEAICMQRGISLEDHQRCMCEGSFFEDWLGCRQCLRVNGALGEVEVEYWSSVMSGASTAMCDGESAPTTYWQDYFGSAIVTAEPPTEYSQGLGKTTLVTETDVSLYYTAPDSQGPGITPTVTPQTESETGTGTETTTTTSSDESSTTETETQTGDGQGNDDEDAAGRFYAHGAASVAAVVAGAALVMIL
jgi:hypothetical protein